MPIASSVIYSLGMPILRDATAFPKKSFIILATSESSCIILSHSINAMSFLPAPLSEKKDFIVFHNFLLFVTFFII